MAADPPGRFREVGRTVSDVLVYALVIVPPVLLGALLAGVGSGGGLVGTKVVLFGVGWALVALATIRLWPKSPRQVDPTDPGTEPGAPTPVRGNTRIESIAAELPPRRFTETPTYRVSPATKLFVSGLCVLLCSFLLETVFSVG